jgi:hypothetical protein
MGGVVDARGEKVRAMSTVRYPNVTCRLVGTDGNAFALIARVKRALERAGVPEDEVQEFVKQATSSDYDKLLLVIHDWVVVE